MNFWDSIELGNAVFFCGRRWVYRALLCPVIWALKLIVVLSKSWWSEVGKLSANVYVLLESCAMHCWI